jgi:hypothetical protein
MSTDGGSDAKYEVILQKLVELKALAVETDKKVGVLHAAEERHEAERRRKAKEEAEDRARGEARRQREVEANRQAVAAIKAAEAKREEERLRAHYGSPG